MSKQSFTTGQVLTAAQMTTLQANDYNQTVSAKVASYTLVATDAGTRITMSNAAATTVTVNTALFTAGDTLIITNIGAGVCTITAGTATVSTGGSLALAQYDSGTLYFTSTGVAIWNGVNPGDITGVTASTGLSGGGTSGTVSLAIDSTVATLTGTQTLTNKTLTSPALTTPTISTLTTNGDLLYGTGSGALSRLGIGSTSQVLTVTGGVPVWATAGGGAGLTLVKSQVIGSAVSSVTVTSAFSATYDAYAVIVTGGTGSVNDENITMQLGSTTTGYYAAYIGATFSTSASTIATNNNASNFTRAGIGSTNGIQCSFQIINPFLAKRTFLANGIYGGDTQSRTWGGYVDNTTSYTAFTLTPASGTLTGGTIFIYGYSLT